MRTLLPLVLCIAAMLFCMSSTNPISQDLPELSPEEMTVIANKVFNDLKQAKGILPTEPPFLKVREFTGSIKMAVFYKDLNEIHLDSLSYEIMREMGKDSTDALAFLLGHELGHFINKHKKVNHAIEDAAPQLAENRQMMMLSSDVEASQALPNFEERFEKAVVDFNDTHDEAEADFEGAFLGYLAGYTPMKAGREFLKRAYDHPFMNLTNKSPGYPPLTERLGVIEKTTEELEQLIPLFETATYLMAIKQYEDAIPYLEKVLLKFESREIYNNIGVISILEILGATKGSFTDYKFPLTLDANIRIPHPSLLDEDGDGDVDIFDLTPNWINYMGCDYSTLQLRIANIESYFLKAISLDKDYATAYLNLSIAQCIKAEIGFYINNNIEFANDCKIQKEEDLRKSLGIALSAKEIATRSMKGFTAKLHHQSIEELVNEDINTDSQVDSVIPNEDSVFVPSPSSLYKNINFPRGGSKRTGIDLPELPTKITWTFYVPETDGDIVIFDNSKIEEVPMPNLAYLLSNIYIQIDLIRISLGEMNDGKLAIADPYNGESKDLVVFKQALEINPKNQLAIYNRSVATGNKTQLSNSGSTPSCLKKEEFQGNSLKDLREKISEWENLATVVPSRLVIKNPEDVLPEVNFTSAVQNLKYFRDSKFTIYESSSDIADDGRLERSTFLIPIDQDAPTLCGIKKSDDIELLLGTYGTPTGSVSLSGGSLIIYQQSNERRLKGTKTTSSGREEAFEILGNVFPQNTSAITSAINREDGIIFRLDASSKIKSWVLYHRFINTIPVIEDDEDRIISTEE